MKWMQSFFLLFFLFLAPITAQGGDSFNFTQVAKMATPAVVTIKVKTANNNSSPTLYFYNEEGDETDAQDLFQRRFFDQFFRRSPRFQQQVPSEPVAQGTGFIVTPDGYIVTNNHVIQQAENIFVLLNDNMEYPAKVIGIDPNTDIAVLKIDGSNMPHLTFGDSDHLDVGQWVVAIGNPFGLQSSLTVGVVSAKGRNGLDLSQIEDFIQTDAAINRGNSGGPLLNLDGKVVGINTAMVGRMGYQNTGIGFAIPSNLAKQVMDQLIAHGEVSHGFMGVLLQNVDRNLAESFDLKRPHGALIAEVTPGSPAEKAGLRQGDLILKYNGQEVKNIAQLKTVIASMAPSSSVQLLVKRQDTERTISVQLADSPPIAAKEERGESNKLGVTVEDITPSIEQMYGYRPGNGVVITKVESGSIAEWAGLRKGALILSVNQQSVPDTKRFYSLVKSTSEGRPLLLLIKQGNVTRFLSLKIG